MTTDQMNLPFVSILMPVRNERDFIEGSLGSVLAQDYPIDRLEILVVDGMSDDGTREYVERCAVNNRQPTLTLLDNPKKIVATAMNIGMRSARGGIILRVDGHCEISPGHLRHCVERLTATRNVPAGVGGPVETVSESVVGRAIAAAMSSRFGVGGSSFRIGVETERFADTVPFPAYTLTTIEAAGPYDEELVRNQDDEYNYRIRGLGGDLLLDPALRSRYYSRASLRKLWRQYFQYGYWKVRVLQKHPKQMSLRQFVPAALVVAIVGAGILSIVMPGSRALAASVPLVYLAAMAGASLLIAARQGLVLLSILPLAFLALHLGYGAGFLTGLARFWNRWGDRSTLVDGSRTTVGKGLLRESD